MENKAIIQFTDASVHEFRVVSAQGGGRMVYAYIRDRGNPPVMYRVPLPSGTDIGQGMTLTLTGWVSRCVALGQEHSHCGSGAVSGQAGDRRQTRWVNVETTTSEWCARVASCGSR